MKFDVYSDETYVKDRYLGIGCLFVPHSKKYTLYEKLTAIRCLNEESLKWNWDFDECNMICKEKRHRNNNCEIHHTKLEKNTSYSRKEISKKWIKLLMNNNKNDEKMIYFNILYIDLDKLNTDLFGEKDVQTAIYQRFFRTTILSGSNHFFGNKIEIENIYHDNADAKEQHNYFSWHIGNFIKNNMKRMKIKNTNISFIDSDHKKYLKPFNDEIIDSHFIQFIDLILGTVSQTLFVPSKDVEKVELSSIIYPLVKRLIKNHKNTNSSCHHAYKQSISVFPKNKIELTKDLHDNTIEKKGEFHRNLAVKKPNFSDEKKSLDNWFNK